MLNRFNLMPVKDKKPLVAWTNLIESEQPIHERIRIIKDNPVGNIGVVCGPVSRLFVLDDDGSEELKKYLLPRTATVKTPRGGRHYYFKWTRDLDDKVTTRTGVLDKVDTRGHGGYVVFYGWDVPPTIAPFAEPPKWLIDKLPNKVGKREIADKPTPVDVIKNISEDKHNRNASFASLAGGLRRDGKSAEYIFELLKPKAKEVNFSEEELWLVCKSVERYAPAKQNDPVTVIDDDISMDQLLKLQDKVEWVVPNMIPKKGIGFMAGLPEACKTWIILDLALCMATGGKWLNKFPVEKCKVYYIDQERIKAEMKRRVSALLAAKGLSSDQFKETFISRCAANHKIHLNVPNSFTAFEQRLEVIRPDFVIVDSFKTFHSSNELSSQDQQFIMQKLQTLRDKYGCGFIFVHHEPKSVIQKRMDGAKVHYTDAAGTIDLAQTADTFFNVVSQSESVSIMHHTKLNGGTKAAPTLVKVVDLVPDKSKIVVEAY